MKKENTVVPKPKHIGLRLSEDLYSKVQDAAKNANRSMSNWVETQLKKAFENSGESNE